MAAYTQTPSLVVPSTSAIYVDSTAGGTIAAGMPCYLDTTALDAQNRPSAKMVDANAATAAASATRGIAVNSASLGQPIRIVTSDPNLAHGLTGVTAGAVVVTGATPGALHPVADLTTGWRPSVVMITTSSTHAVVGIVNGGVAIP
jgi:hypothetical protein